MNMTKYAGLAMLTVCVVCTVCMTSERSQYKNQIDALGETITDLKRKLGKTEIDKFRLQWTPDASYFEKQFMLRLCADIENCCNDGHGAGLRKYMDRLDGTSVSLNQLTVTQLEDLLVKPFQEEFFFAKKLQDFPNVGGVRGGFAWWIASGVGECLTRRREEREEFNHETHETSRKWDVVCI